MTFCSYIVPTIGRKSLETAVQSILMQDFEHGFEVIIVNDSGSPLPDADWHHLPNVRILNTNKRERSIARNTGAAVARGSYLAFLDDDDWILPGALESFWQLSIQKPEALWLYGGIKIVDEHHSVLAEINSGLSGNCFAQIMGGAWAPIQSSMIQSRAFFKIGGFNPSISGTEDEDLCRQSAYLGEFVNTSKAVACLYRGQVWKTSTNYLRGPEDTKYSRDLILSQPGAFQRLMSSAESSYWYGRILRVYISTIPWNLKRKRFFTGLSRVMYSLAAFVLSLQHVLSTEYWQGVRADHVPHSLHFVIKAYEQRMKQKEPIAG